MENVINVKDPWKRFLHVRWHLSLLLSRMRNLLVTPLQVPLPLSPTMTRKTACSSAAVPTPSAIHLWRNASPSRASLPARANRLRCADSSPLTPNCCRAGNLHLVRRCLLSWSDQYRTCISSVMLQEWTFCKMLLTGWSFRVLRLIFLKIWLTLNKTLLFFNQFSTN